MKIDKEYLAKHHFWFLLAAYTPMVLLGLILLWTSVAGAIDGEANKIKSIKAEVQKYAKADVKNQAWINGFKGKADELAKQKNKVWAEVWLGQSTLFTWPEPLAELESYEYGDDIREAQKRDTYINDKNCYRKQLRDLVATVQPVNEKGEGVVQFQGSWKEILTHVPRWYGTQGGPLVVPSSEEIWLAQEDLWIQRELLQVIRDTNDGLALYEKSKNPPKPRKDEIDRQVFENPRWRLELGLAKGELRWQVTNRSPRLQTLALTFRLTFKPKTPKPLDLWVDGEPLAPNQSSKEITVKLPGPFSPSAIEVVEQALDWRTAPVKRIDRLKLAYVSASTSGKPLLAYPKFAPKDDAGGGAPIGAPGGAMQGAGPMPGGPGFPGGERPGGPGGGKTGDMGLVRERYIETSDQVRRMPVALVLIVDQAHVQDVLTSFAKSRLRFQTTQVEWKRYRGSIQPTVAEEGAGGEMGPGGIRRRPPTAPPGAVGVRPPPMGKPGVPAADQPEDDEDSSNLVELGLYGIASLYGKYPPKGPAAEAPPAPGGPVTPAPGTPAPAPGTPAPAPGTPLPSKQ